jgi:hypothetical protein
MVQTATLPTSLRTLIQSGLLSKAVSISDRRPCLLFCRHSDRPHLPPNSCGSDVHLTTSGVAKAQLLGSCLKELNIQPGLALMCSPIARNTDTIREILNGGGWHDHVQRVVTDRRILGPGTIYESDINVDDVVASYCGSGFGSYEIFNEIVNGQAKRFYGVKLFDDGAKSIFELVKEVLMQQVGKEQPARLSIMISHDMHVAYVLAKLFEIKKFDDLNWPPFLDGILFQLVENETKPEEYTLNAVYGDKVIESGY